MLTDLINNKKIRFHFIWSLVFSFLLIGCADKKKETLSVNIQWNGNRAESIVVPLKLLPYIPKDSIELLLQIQLANTNAPILGEYIITEDAVVFQPLIAFTRGLKYQVRLRDNLLSEIEIPLNNAQPAPEVVAIYPSSDTVPLNLLKIYIVFSKPMQEGQSLNNIAVIKNGKDTIPSIFLDLQPELWNKERTILTLWLDPGRIKRDLQPNKKMGLPLEQGGSYQIIVKQNWQDMEADSLAFIYRKEFMVGLWDNSSPDIRDWTMVIPKSGSNEPLKIELHESLDYLLLKNTFRIIDSKGNVIKTVIETDSEEMVLNLIPSVAWSSGDYIVEIESRLEDLAGNNLNRLFDREITNKSKELQKEIYTMSFHIK